MASDHWTGYVLDTGAHGHLFRRFAGRTHLRLAGDSHDVLRLTRRTGGRCAALGFSGSLRGLVDYLGIAGDADFGSLRYLVARWLWSRCQHPEPAAYYSG